MTVAAGSVRHNLEVVVTARDRSPAGKMDLFGGGSGDNEVERRSAGRGRGRGSWAPMPSNAQEVQMLRRPHHAVPHGTQAAGSTEPKNLEQSKSDKPYDIVKNSTLSVHAAEFVPKSYSGERPAQSGMARPVPKTSLRDRILLARELSNHTQMIHTPYYTQNYEQHYQQTEQSQQFQNFSQQQQGNQHAGTQDYGQFDGGAGDYKDRNQELNRDENNMLDLANTTQHLLNVIRSLILNPGRFSSLVPPLINSLRPYLEFPSQFRKIISIIIRQSIDEGNFRYSGARLCTCLDTTVASNEQASFREILYSLCKEETESQAHDWQHRSEYTDEIQKKCHGLILFLAELVTQMEHTAPFGLGELLVELITVVLRSPAPNSVKHICQALKLAGQTLEREKGGTRKEMENMMRALTELVTQGRVDSHVGRMVHSVHELRNGNWGQSPSTGSIMENVQSIETPDRALDEPVMYGPDGKILSAEENQFLEDVAQSSTNTDDPVIEPGCDDTSEDDEEVDVAYEQFLKMIPNKIENKTQK